jgi:large-conductance mechanosensitive channel
MERLRSKQEKQAEAAAPVPAPTRTEELLSEIKDLLKEKK